MVINLPIKTWNFLIHVGYNHLCIFLLFIGSLRFSHSVFGSHLDLPSFSSFQSHYFFLPTQFCVLGDLDLSIEANLYRPNILRCVAFHWITVNLSGVTSSEAKNFPKALWLGVDLYDQLPLSCWFWVWLTRVLCELS